MEYVTERELDELFEAVKEKRQMDDKKVHRYQQVRQLVKKLIKTHLNADISYIIIEESEDDKSFPIVKNDEVALKFQIARPWWNKNDKVYFRQLLEKYFIVDYIKEGIKLVIKDN